jgi:DNA-binding YbaB/EbfC family protein
MFDNLKALMNLGTMLPRIKEEKEKLEQRLGQVTAEGDAGAGMVKVKVNGRMEVLSCSLSEEAFASGDREMLEDLIRAATNQAIAKVRQQAVEETGKMMASLGLPPGMVPPGMGLPGGS